MSSPAERRRARPVREQLAPLWALLPIWFAGTVVVAFVSTGDDEAVQTLMRDPADLLGGVWYTGLVTHLSVLCLAAAVVSAGWGAWCARLQGRTGAAGFLTWGALLGAYVATDEIFQLHAVVLPAAGLPKQMVVVLLGGGVAAWMARWQAEVRRTRWAILGAAACALGGSVLVDVVAPFETGRANLLIEDGLKFLGMLAWATYFVATTADICRSLLGSARRAEDAPEPTRVAPAVRAPEPEPAAPEVDETEVWARALSLSRPSSGG